MISIFTSVGIEIVGCRAALGKVEVIDRTVYINAARYTEYSEWRGVSVLTSLGKLMRALICKVFRRRNLRA